jgi:hypothetical protein
MGRHPGVSAQFDRESAPALTRIGYRAESSRNMWSAEKLCEGLGNSVFWRQQRTIMGRCGIPATDKNEAAPNSQSYRAKKSVRLHGVRPARAWTGVPAIKSLPRGAKHGKFSNERHVVHHSEAAPSSSEMGYFLPICLVPRFARCPQYPENRHRGSGRYLSRRAKARNERGRHSGDLYSPVFTATMRAYYDKLAGHELHFATTTWAKHINACGP